MVAAAEWLVGPSAAAVCDRGVVGLFGRAAALSVYFLAHCRQKEVV